MISIRYDATTKVDEERVLLDRSKVLCVLSRIAAELDALAGRPAPGSQGAAMDKIDSRQWLRERMPDIDAHVGSAKSALRCVKPLILRDGEPLRDG
jgi:hypothetical protein